MRLTAKPVSIYNANANYIGPSKTPGHSPYGAMPPASTVVQHRAQRNHDNFRIPFEPEHVFFVCMLKNIFSSSSLGCNWACFEKKKKIDTEKYRPKASAPAPTPPHTRLRRMKEHLHPKPTLHQKVHSPGLWSGVNIGMSAISEWTSGWMGRPFNGRRDEADLFLIDGVCSFLQRPPVRWRGSGDRAGWPEWTGEGGGRESKMKKKDCCIMRK